MHFDLTHDTLVRLCAINSFPIPENQMVFFGLRGSLPLNLDGTNFAIGHQIQLTDPDYTHPRCTLGQWLPAEGKLALFPGSTVPNLKYVKPAKARGGVGANQLMTGLYDDYRKGVHQAGKSSAHQAFRQTEGRPIRRTSDDFDFENDDRVEFMNPFDNLHAAWCMSVNHPSYASAGCQVVVGFPKCSTRSADAGPWKVFKANAYKLAQESFSYFLLEGRDAMRAAGTPQGEFAARLRYGSQGPLVTDLQKALQKKGFYEGTFDEDFGQRTVRAVLEFQTAEFGPDTDDGIVGPTTAGALGLKLPKA
jgi:hypothetical protein